MWNFTLRLCLESSLDLGYTTLINLKYGEFTEQPSGAKANFIWSAVLAGFYLGFPFFLVGFYLRRFGELDR